VVAWSAAVVSYASRRRRALLWLATLGGLACASAPRRNAEECRAAGVADANRVYLQGEVERPAVEASTDVPPLAREASSATFRFVVDTAGFVEAGSVKVVRTNDPRFASEIAHAIAGWCYRPAELISGCRVRQVVEVPIEIRWLRE
jgi:hypothetical protein